MVWNAPWSGAFPNAHHFVCTFFQFHVFRLLGGSCAPATQTAADTWETLTLPVSLAHQTPTVRWENKIFVNWVLTSKLTWAAQDKEECYDGECEPKRVTEVPAGTCGRYRTWKHLDHCFWNQTSHGADYKTTLDWTKLLVGGIKHLNI